MLSTSNGKTTFPSIPAPKKYKAKMDTLRITKGIVSTWKKPTFQRDFRETPRIQALVAELKTSDGVIPGVITLGEIMQNGSREVYLVDGQHRIQAFLIAGLDFGYADVRICSFETMADMSEEFVQLNQSLVRMQNDDILRGIEGSNPHLSKIRKLCPFIGYNQIRMVNPNGMAKLTISLTVAIRAWYGSETPTPTPGPSTIEAASRLTDDHVKEITEFYSMVYEAWGGDKQHFRLWGGLNVGIVAWLYRRMVLAQHVNNTHRSTKVTKEQFRACCMALSANHLYLDWLHGRNMRFADRSPAYGRIRDIFARRLAEQGIKGPKFPQPEWVG